MKWDIYPFCRKAKVYVMLKRKRYMTLPISKGTLRVYVMEWMLREIKGKNIEMVLKRYSQI